MKQPAAGADDLDTQAGQIMSLLGDDDPDEGAPADKQSADNADEATGEPGEESEEAAAGDGDSTADDVEAEGEPGEGDQQPQTFRVQVDGEEIEVPLDELLKGYSRQADYTRKTTSLTEERQRFDAERQDFVQRAQAEVARLAQLAQMVVSSDPLLAEAAKVDWAKLAEADPDEYTRLRARVDARLSTLERVMQEQARVTQEAQQALLQREADALRRAIPDFADRDKAKSLRAEMQSYLADLGFHEDEIRGIHDHRVVKIIHDAMQHRKLNSERAKAAQKKVVEAKPAPKNVKPNSAARGAQRLSVDKRKFAKLDLFQQADALANLL